MAHEKLDKENPLYAADETEYGNTSSDKRELIDIDVRKYTVSPGSPQPGGWLHKMSMLAIVLLQILTLFVVVIVLGVVIVNLREDQQETSVGDASSDQLTGTDSPSTGSTCNNDQIVGYLANNTAMLNKMAEANRNTADSLASIGSTLTDVQNTGDASADMTTMIREVLSHVHQTTQNATNKLNNIVSTLSNLKDTGVSTSAAVDDILVVVEELLRLQNGSSLLNSITPISCKDIKAILPNSPSGYYHVNSRNIYCNMDELCSSTDGWTRIAYLDMTDSTQNCPSSMLLKTDGGKRACRRTGNGASCNSVSYPSNGISYSEVCGRVHAYQYGHTDAISPGNQGYGIDSYYVDGISITRGSPRQHVWTFMSGLFENKNSPTDTCPCYPGSTIDIGPTFIGNDYFCESGNPKTYYDLSYYTDDPLWDGDCTSFESPCCSPPFNLPWFHKVLTNSTTDYIELRLCGNEHPYWAEDNPVYFYEIYVK